MTSSAPTSTATWLSITVDPNALRTAAGCLPVLFSFPPLIPCAPVFSYARPKTNDSHSHDVEKYKDSLSPSLEYQYARSEELCGKLAALDALDVDKLGGGRGGDVFVCDLEMAEKEV